VHTAAQFSEASPRLLQLGSASQVSEKDVNAFSEIKVVWKSAACGKLSGTEQKR